MFRRILTVIVIVYVVCLGVVLPTLEFWGERNWLLSLLLFAPPQLFALPAALLIVPVLLFRMWKSAALLVICALAVLFGFMTFRWNSRGEKQAGEITLVTHNIGQWNKQQFREFVAESKPDILLLQDARFRAADFGTVFPDQHVVARGEFVCVSRFPVLDAVLLKKPVWEGRETAARFEVEIEGTRTAVYSVHMPTPRAYLRPFLRKQVIVDVATDKPTIASKNYQQHLAERVELTQELRRVLSEEKLPVIAAGDFNMPDHGYAYHLLAGQVTDVFATRGHGWGLTFPGGTGLLNRVIGPWVRIDYIFTGPGWEPVFCRTDQGRLSQHRAVLGILRRAH